MVELKELNHAGEQGVFGSIRVLGEIDSDNLKTIKRDVNIMQNVQTKVNTKINNYWTSLSDDGIITTGEKQQLRREWETIQQTYAALLAQATAKALISTSYWTDYQDAYDDLRDLLFITEKVFDDMHSDTTLTDKDNFNDIFHAYYYSEQFVQVAIMSGLIDKLGLRGLEDLTEEGTEGELAFYRGELYQYHNNAWARIGTESYLGTLSTHVQQLDEATEGNYFLAAARFAISTNLIINGEQLIINDKMLVVSYLTLTGKIYSFNNGYWHVVDDDDPRYLAILADYMNLTGQVPALLLDTIEEVVRDPVRNPQYLGVSNTIPSSPKKGDYFVYSGTTTGSWTKNRIYRYDGSDWEVLDPDNDGDSHYYMSALQDILTLEQAGDGYFSMIFCNAFFTNKASINALKVQTIYLYGTGVIQSEQQTYVAETTGLKIDASGNIDANGNTHLGAGSSNKLAIGVKLTNNTDFNNFDVVIGGKVLLYGNLISRGFGIAGIEPGRGSGSYKLYDFQTNNSAKMWQVCGEGSAAMVGYFTGSLFLAIYRNGFKVRERSYYKGSSSTTYIAHGVAKHYDFYDASGNIDFDIALYEGDEIIIDSRYIDEGGADQDYWIPGGTAGIGLYTKYSCGILRYLGKELDIPADYHPAL